MNVPLKSHRWSSIRSFTLNNSKSAEYRSPTIRLLSLKTFSRRINSSSFEQVAGKHIPSVTKFYQGKEKASRNIYVNLNY